MLNKLREFMRGRYGSDQLNLALIITAFVVSLANGFARSLVLYGIQILLVLFAVYRMLSKKIQTRLRENRAFLRVCEKIKGFFTSVSTRVRDRKTHAYKKCPRCGAKLRLPRTRGEHGVKCPRCGTQFRVKIR